MTSTGHKALSNFLFACNSHGYIITSTNEYLSLLELKYCELEIYHNLVQLGQGLAESFRVYFILCWWSSNSVLFRHMGFSGLIAICFYNNMTHDDIWLGNSCQISSMQSQQVISLIQCAKIKYTLHGTFLF